MGLEPVRPGIKAKFEQNPLLLQMLQTTHPKTIAEATYDNTWGTGIPLDSPDALIETGICRNSIYWQHIPVNIRSVIIDTG